MRIRYLTDEDFVQYKVPSMFIGMCFCSWKCCHDGGFDETVCQNNALATATIHDIPNTTLIRRYLENDITHAIVFGGLEPFEQADEIIEFITMLRDTFHCQDDVVIYTGYNMDELHCLDALAQYTNVIVKFGRYVPGQRPHLDPVLGVMLASDNQYATQLSKEI